MQISSKKISNKLALRRAARQQADALKRSFGDALRRRLYPHTGLKREVLAAAIGVSHGTISNHVNGTTGINLAHFWVVAAFFGPAFLHEVLSTVGVIPVRVEDTERASTAAKALKLGEIANAIDDLRHIA